MNTVFGIKNFRVFDENGVNIELSPITILTGRNSSGKSSIVKGIAVLSSFLEQIRTDKEYERTIDLSNYKIQFGDLFEKTLGNFEDVLHRGTDNHCITFEYTIHSTMLFQDVKVSFSFKDADEGKDNNHLHYGILNKFCVKTLLGEEIYLSTDNGKFCYNLDLIKKDFYDFALFEYLTQLYLGISSNEDYSREKKRELSNMAKEELDKYSEKIAKNVYQYLRKPFSAKTTIIDDYDRFELLNNYDKQIFFIPVIDECLKGLYKDNLSAKVDEILNDDEILDDAEKYVIKHLISDIIDSGKEIDVFWLEQEKLFLSSLGKEETQTEKQKELLFVYRLGKNGVKLPNQFIMRVGDGFWENYPGLWIMKNENKDKKAKEIEEWKETPINSFPKMYETLMRLNTAYEKWMKKNSPNFSPHIVYSYEGGREYPAGLYTHFTYQLLCKYASRAIEELLFPVWTEKFIYISSSRALPKRIYMAETDRDFYNTLNEYLIAKTEYEDYQKTYSGRKKNYIINSFLNKWIGDEGFKIGKTISIESFVGSAIVLKLVKEDGNKVFLTDEGFGLIQLVSLLITEVSHPLVGAF